MIIWLDTKHLSTTILIHVTSLFDQLVIFIAPLIIMQHLLGLFEYEFMEDDGEDGAGKGEESVDPYVVEHEAALIEQHCEISPDSDRWVEYGTWLSHGFSIEHGTAAHVRGSDDEAVNGLFLWEIGMGLGLWKIEESNKEGSNSFGQNSTKGKTWMGAFEGWEGFIFWAELPSASRIYITAIGVCRWIANEIFIIAIWEYLWSFINKTSIVAH